MSTRQRRPGPYSRRPGPSVHRMGLCPRNFDDNGPLGANKGPMDGGTPGRPYFFAAARSSAMSVIKSSCPPTSPRSPTASKMERVSSPYCSAAVSACRRKLE